MMDVLRYKGFIGSVHFSADDMVFFGKIDDLVTFEGKDVQEIKSAFHEAAMDYLAICREHGKTRRKPRKASFNIRIQPELHRKALQASSRKGITLNAWSRKPWKGNSRTTDSGTCHVSCGFRRIDRCSHSGYACISMDDDLGAKVDRRFFSVARFTDPSDEKKYWAMRSTEERMAAVEILRRINYGYDPATARLQRLLEIAQQTPR